MNIYHSCLVLSAADLQKKNRQRKKAVPETGYHPVM